MRVTFWHDKAGLVTAWHYKAGLVMLNSDPVIMYFFLSISHTDDKYLFLHTFGVQCLSLNRAS